MLPGAAPGLVLAPSSRLAAALADWGLQPGDLRLLAAVDGGRDLAGTALAAGLEPAEAADVVRRLLAAGLVDLAASTPAAPPAPAAPAAPPALRLARPPQVPLQVSLPATPLRLALPDEAPAPVQPAPDADHGPVSRLAAAPAPPPPLSPAPDADVAALLRELSLLHVTRPVAPPPPAPAAVPPPPAVAPSAAAPADRRKRGLFGRG